MLKKGRSWMVIRVIKKGTLVCFLGLLNRGKLGKLLRWIKWAVLGGY